MFFNSFFILATTRETKKELETQLTLWLTENQTLTDKSNELENLVNEKTNQLNLNKEIFKNCQAELEFKSVTLLRIQEEYSNLLKCQHDSK